MHMRHDRNPKDGYSAGRSRSLLEGPTGVPGFYNSKNRSFNRSFSDKQSQNDHRNFHRPPPAHPMPARANVFVEAGRLAAEYLVSRGVLPPGVLPAKCQNGSLKNPLSKFEEYRPHKEEKTRFPGEARTSAFSRLGNTGFGVEPGRRKYNDDYGAVGPRNHGRGKEKGGSSRNFGSDWGSEYGPTGSWPDRHHDRTSLSRDLDRDGSSRHREEHPVGKDGGERMADDSSSGHHEENRFGKDDDRMDVDQETRCRPHEEQVLGKGGNDISELSCSSATPPQGVDNKDSESETKGQKVEELSEIKNPDVIKETAEMTAGEIKTDSLDRGSSQKMLDYKLRISGEATEVDLRNKGDIAREINDPSKDETVEEIISGDVTPENLDTDMSLSEKSCTDPNSLCKLANVPTRVRSSLAKGTNRRSVLSGKGIDHIELTDLTVNDNNLSVSTNNGSSGCCDEPKVLNSEMPGFLRPRGVEGEKGLHFDGAIGPAQELDSWNSFGDGKPDSTSLLDQASGARPESLEDGMLTSDQSFNEELHGSGSRDPVVEKRGEKRQHGGIDVDGQQARRKERLYQSPKDWLSPPPTNAGKCSSLVNPLSNEVDIVGDSLSSGKNETRVDHSCPVNNFQLPEVIHKPHFMDKEEKQFFPSSFKICDLNLMESSHGHDNQGRDAIFKYPTGAAVKKNASPIDINLSICNPVTSAENSKCMAGGKEVEIIDLEGDSAQEEKALRVTERRSENAFMGLEESLTPAPNTAEIPDSQDGYSPMISELLANDFPSIAPVPGDVNPLDNRGLHNGEAPLADDDPIYMSLGEMPFLSFLWNWENPALQKDGKPF